MSIYWVTNCINWITNCINWITRVFWKSSKLKRNRITHTSISRDIQNVVNDDDDDDDDITTEQKCFNIPLVTGVHNRIKSPTKYVTPGKNKDVDVITEEAIFDKLNQTLLIHPSTYFHLPIDMNATDLRLEPGVSFLAYCNNMDYHDTIIPVIIHKGYYPDSRGLFTLSEEVWELNCPKCKQTIQGNNAQGIGFSKCNVEIKYRNVNGASDSFNFTIGMNTFAFTQLSRPGQIKYKFVKFTVNILF